MTASAAAVQDIPAAVREELDAPFALTEDHKQRFREDGFIKLKDVLSAEAIAYYEPILTRVTFENDPNQGVALEDKDTYGKAFIQVPNLWRLNDEAKAFSFSKRLARIAAELLGADGVRMWHDQCLYKEAGGGFTPWHADQHYWPMMSMQSVTAWIPLQAVPQDMGPLAFARGSHTVPAGREIAISDASEQAIDAHVAEHGFEQVYEPFDLGDVSFHYGFTLHRAGPNTTGTARKVHTIIYMGVRK